MEHRKDGFIGIIIDITMPYYERIKEGFIGIIIHIIVSYYDRIKMMKLVKI